MPAFAPLDKPPLNCDSITALEVEIDAALEGVLDGVLEVGEP